MLTVLWQTKTTVSFPLLYKLIANEHHVIRKVMTPHKKNVVHLNLPRGWFETNPRSIKNVNLKEAKTSWMSRSTERVIVSFACLIYGRMKSPNTLYLDLWGGKHSFSHVPSCSFWGKNYLFYLIFVINIIIIFILFFIIFFYFSYFVFCQSSGLPGT